LLSLVCAASGLGDLWGKAALATKLVDLTGELFSIALVLEAVSCRDLSGVGAEGTVALDVDLVFV
jgi:crotonobetainyl-CoA:carnitine CoA-transferase CaiB-like acyl-CoA transferase